MYDALLNCTGCVCTASELWVKGSVGLCGQKGHQCQGATYSFLLSEEKFKSSLHISVNSVGKAQMEKCYFGGKLISDIELFP